MLNSYDLLPISSQITHYITEYFACLLYSDKQFAVSLLVIILLIFIYGSVEALMVLKSQCVIEILMTLLIAQ